MKVLKDNLSEPVTAKSYYQNFCVLFSNAEFEEGCSEDSEEIIANFLNPTSRLKLIGKSVEEFSFYLGSCSNWGENHSFQDKFTAQRQSEIENLVGVQEVQLFWISRALENSWARQPLMLFLRWLMLTKFAFFVPSVELEKGHLWKRGKKSK